MGKVEPVRLSSGAFVPYHGEGGAGQTLLWGIRTVSWGRWSRSDSPLGHSYRIMGKVEPVRLSSGAFVLYYGEVSPLGHSYTWGIRTPGAFVPLGCRVTWVPDFLVHLIIM